MILLYAVIMFWAGWQLVATWSPIYAVILMLGVIVEQNISKGDR